MRIYKVAMTWPLEESGAKRFAEGLQDILVVEEKRGFIEDQLMRILYNVDAGKRPSIAGKRDESGAPLLPSEGELNPTIVAAALVARLRRLGHQSPVLEQRLARLEAFDRPATGQAAISLQRTPFFCSGCPHNTSTRLPEGSRAMAGIGCHGMALSIPSRRTATITHMGAEGANWIGQAPFTNEQHIFQNLGDGTYTHSGLLALRAAAVSGVNITYKILYNDAVAMTGGQPAEGGFTVAQIAHQVWAEGTKRLAIVSDDPDKYPANYFPAGATVHHRRDLDAVQRELREIKGLTALIYDQTCAAEKRRRRKRGLYPDPPKRVFINESGLRRLRRLLADLELRLGAAARHRVRPQAPDRPVELQQGLFLRRGFLPELCDRAWRLAEAAEELGGRFRPALRRPAAAGGTARSTSPTTSSSPASAAPASSPSARCSAWPRMSTARAARRSTSPGCRRRTARSMSHVRIAAKAEDISTVRITNGGADLILGCDMVVSAGATALSRVDRGVTRAFVNADLQPTASFVQNPDIDFETGRDADDAARRHRRAQSRASSTPPASPRP